MKITPDAILLVLKRNRTTSAEWLDRYFLPLHSVDFFMLTKHFLPLWDWQCIGIFLNFHKFGTAIEKAKMNLKKTNP